MLGCKKFLCGVFVLLLMLGFSEGSLSIVTMAQTTPTLSVNPSVYTAGSLGETVFIQVYVYQVSNVTAYQFHLSFNTTLLQCLNASVGNWFPAPPNSSSTVTVNNSGGVISIQANLTNGVSPLSVFGTFHGTLLNAYFNVTYGTPYPQSKASCTLSITNAVLYGLGGTPIQGVQVQNGAYLDPYLTPNINLTLTTDKNAYHYEERININGSFTANGYPLPDSLVALEIMGPNGSPFVARTFQTSNDSLPCPIQITALYTCDAFGDPQSSFALGNVAYFFAQMQNVGPTPLIGMVLINPYDSSNASLGVVSAAISLPVGGSDWVILQLVLQYSSDQYVITPATSGTATLCASFWTNHTEYGGLPLSIESRATFTLTGTAQGKPAFTNPPAQGTYQASNWTIHFLKGIYSSTLPPNYTIGVNAQYMGNAWSQNKTATQSKQIRITIAGDINLDGAVSLSDLVLPAKAYNTDPSSKNWNPAADINGDGKVNISDLTLMAKNYNKGTGA
jgi:hypothetical protein